ncbi:MAG TPA: hypothetical protein VNU66_14105 [Mycobacteriales bacterium]|nr:hypothetical protein [Mycobacteriales bacterium]
MIAVSGCAAVLRLVALARVRWAGRSPEAARAVVGANALLALGLTGYRFPSEPLLVAGVALAGGLLVLAVARRSPELLVPDAPRPSSSGRSDAAWAAVGLVLLAAVLWWAGP